MELTYTKVGDYYILDLVLDDQPDRPLGPVRADASKVPGGTPPRHLQSADALRQTVDTLGRH